MKQVAGGVRLTGKEHRAFIYFWTEVAKGAPLGYAEERARYVYRGLDEEFYRWMVKRS